MIYEWWISIRFVFLSSLLLNFGDLSRVVPFHRCEPQIPYLVQKNIFSPVARNYYGLQISDTIITPIPSSQIFPWNPFVQVQLNPSIVLAQAAPFLHGLPAHSLTSKGKNEAEFINTLPTKKKNGKEWGQLWKAMRLLSRKEWGLYC